MTESVQAANIIGSVLAEPAVKITVECRLSGHLDLPSAHHIDQKLQVHFILWYNSDENSTCHNSVKSVRKADCLPALVN